MMLVRLFVNCTELYQIRETELVYDVIVQVLASFFFLETKEKVATFVEDVVSVWFTALLCKPQTTPLEDYPDALKFVVLMYVLNIVMPCPVLDARMKSIFATTHLDFINGMRGKPVLYNMVIIPSQNDFLPMCPTGIFQNMAPLSSGECKFGIGASLTALFNSIQQVRNKITDLAKDRSKDKIDLLNRFNDQDLRKTLGVMHTPGIFDFLDGLRDNFSRSFYWLFHRRKLHLDWDRVAVRVGAFRKVAKYFNLTNLDKQLEKVAKAWDSDKQKHPNRAKRNIYFVKHRAIFLFFLTLALAVFQPSNITVNMKHRTPAVHAVNALTSVCSGAVSLFTVEKAETKFWDLKWMSPRLQELIHNMTNTTESEGTVVQNDTEVKNDTVVQNDTTVAPNITVNTTGSS